MLPRTTGRAERVIRATTERLWQAWFRDGELVRWLTPHGLSGRLIEMKPVPGGTLQLELSFNDPTAPTAEDASGSYVLKSCFISLNPPHGFVFEVFPPEDATTFASPARIEWQFLPQADGTRVVVTCRDMPSVNTPEMNAKALGSALPRLAAHVE